MAEGNIGRADPMIRPTHVVERAGTATDRRSRRDQPERRDKEPPNPKRRRIYDLLFDEIDQIDALDERQRDRVKGNIRDHLTRHDIHPPRHEPVPHATGPTAAYQNAQPPPPPPDGEGVHDEEGLAKRLLETPEAQVPVSHDHIVEMAAPTHPHLPPEEVAENLRLARQLRDCLEYHSERARKVAVYLHLLLALNHPSRPHLVVDI